MLVIQLFIHDSDRIASNDRIAHLHKLTPPAFVLEAELFVYTHVSSKAKQIISMYFVTTRAKILTNAPLSQ